MGILAFVGVVVLLVSCASAYLAYLGPYQIGGEDLEKVASGRAHVLSALRGIRGTSAAYAGAFAVLWLGTVFGPYRRGETGSWWTLLAAMVFLATVAMLRVPLLGGWLGAVPVAIISGVSILGLLLDAGRLRSRA